MKAGEPTLEDLFREAQADLRIGGPEIALKWAFKHAKQVARASLAAECAKITENDRFRAQLELTGSVQVQAVELLTGSLLAAAADLGDARAAECACEHVWQLAAKTPRQQQQPAAHPPQNHVKPKAA